MTPDPVLIHVGNAQKAGKKYGVDPADILGLLSVEGGTDAAGRPVAPGDGAGPASFGQFTFGTGASLGIHFGDSASEVDGIARYLVNLGYHDNRRRALAAYNGGPGNPQYGYADKVIAAAKRYTGAGAKPGDVAGAVASGSADTGGLLDGVRDSAVHALLFIALAAAGVILAGFGISRATGAVA